MPGLDVRGVDVPGVDLPGVDVRGVDVIYGLRENTDASCRSLLNRQLTTGSSSRGQRRKPRHLIQRPVNETEARQ